MTKLQQFLVNISLLLLSTWIIIVRQEPRIDSVGARAAPPAKYNKISNAGEDSFVPAVKKRWISKLKERWKRNHTPCCQDIFKNYDFGTRRSDGTTDLSASCMLGGDECPLYNIYAQARVRAATEGGEIPCIDSKGRARTSGDVHANVIGRGGVDLPQCKDIDNTTPSGSWWSPLWSWFSSWLTSLWWWSSFYSWWSLLASFWWWSSFYSWWSWLTSCWWWWRSFLWGEVLWYAPNLYGIIRTASLPLQFGNGGYRLFETMSYTRRQMATASLWILSSGAPQLWFSFEMHLLRWVWTSWGTTECFVASMTTALFTYIVMRPLPHKFPTRESFENYFSALWVEYFDFTAVDESGLALEADDTEKNNRHILAVLPHAIMPYGAVLGASVLPQMLPNIWPVSAVVATTLMRTPGLRHMVNHIGARKAGRENIHQMFADGFKAVAVITGGIGEMFVQRDKEALTNIRHGLGYTALKGGYSIVPIFVFGASLTHSVVPGFNNTVFRWISRKAQIPLFFWYGAWTVIPRRQQMKGVIGRPIAVDQIPEGATEEDAQAVCDKVQASVLDIYERHRPFWEARPVGFSK